MVEVPTGAAPETWNERTGGTGRPPTQQATI